MFIILYLFVKKCRPTIYNDNWISLEKQPYEKKCINIPRATATAYKLGRRKPKPVFDELNLFIFDYSYYIPTDSLDIL